MAAVLALLVFGLVSSSSRLVKADYGMLNILVSEIVDIEAVEVIITLNQSQYCFVDEDTIKVSGNMTTGNIISATEEIIVATTTDLAESNNNTNILIAPANGSWCSENTVEDDYFTIKLYITQTIILVSITLAAVSNITLHLLYKELRTVLGILIMILCGSVTVATVILIGKTTYRIIHGENENIVLCITLLYALTALLFIYQATKLTILYHFFNLMYQNYRMRPIQADESKHSLAKYITFILVSSILCSLSMALIDFAVNGEMYNAKERYCILKAAKFGGVYDKMFHGEMAVFTLLEIILSMAGFFFYFLVSKKCCHKKSTNIKVIIALTTIVGINIIINIVLGILQCPMNVILPAVTSGTLLEQIILLVLFSSSNKVRANCCVHAVSATASDLV